MTGAIRNCEIIGCDSLIRHDKLFCARHFRMLSDGTKLSLCEYYSIGQDKGDVKPSRAWERVVQEAIHEIRRAERQAVH